MHNYPMFAANKNLDIRKVLININKMPLSLSGWRAILQLSPMNQKTLASLRLGLIWLLIALALLNIAVALLLASESNWVVGIVMLSVAMWVLRNERKLRQLKEERTILQQEILARVQLIDELMRWSQVGHCDPSYICRQCKYFHGRSGVVCAVHPEGCVGNQCNDFESKV